MAYIRYRGDSWSFTIDIGKDPKTGKRKQKTVSGFKSEKDAQKAAVKMEMQLDKGQNVSVPKLVDFLNDFFEEHVKHQVSPMTYHNQRQWATSYIVPDIGHFQMDKLTHLRVEQFYSDLLKRGISRGTIRNISLVLRKTFRAAHKWGVIHNNIMQHASPPTYKPAKMKVWTREQVQLFLQVSQESPNHALYVLALTTGMRIGEMLGLYWSDIDFDTGYVQIGRSLKYTLQVGLDTKEPKNEHSKRTISLPQTTLDALKRYQETTLPGKYIFHKFNDPIYPQEASRRFQNDVAKVGLPKIRFHDMRHTHATMLLMMGVNPKVVAERLGHSTVTTTLDTYSHVIPSMQKEVAAALDQHLF